MYRTKLLLAERLIVTLVYKPAIYTPLQSIDIIPASQLSPNWYWPLIGLLYMHENSWLTQQKCYVLITLLFCLFVRSVDGKSNHATPCLCTCTNYGVNQ